LRHVDDDAGGEAARQPDVAADVWAAGRAAAKQARDVEAGHSGAIQRGRDFRGEVAPQVADVVCRDDGPQGVAVVPVVWLANELEDYRPAVSVPSWGSGEAL
jgi:hypothetical protein